jgi:hypothetical protein
MGAALMLNFNSIGLGHKQQNLGTMPQQSKDRQFSYFNTGWITCWLFDSAAVQTGMEQQISYRERCA